ncbi:MAG: 30S ribosomal protein S4e [Nanoarchaeota archaeon]|nr:30S ribosomal protein S4e [Nanoarchaeota archaeon]MBU4123938.1 30S ribosomal protein S4e [Nanoarchaeota archaeon]
MWLKRMASPRWWPIKRKTHKFITTVRGPHSEALPLQILVRDVLGLAENAKEAKNIINAGNILVDGKIRKDIKFGVGVMDVVEIPTIKKSWRVTPKNGFTLVETSGNDSKLKICRIANKKILKGGKTQINLNDGKNILSNDKYSTRDSLVIEIPSQKVIEIIKFEKGNLALVISGKNQGITAKIQDIDHVNKRVWLERENEKFESPISNIVMIGKDKSAVKIE